jgi:hypothetical protein
MRLRFRRKKRKKDAPRKGRHHARPAEGTRSPEAALREGERPDRPEEDEDPALSAMPQDAGQAQDVGRHPSDASPLVEDWHFVDSRYPDENWQPGDAQMPGEDGQPVEGQPAGLSPQDWPPPQAGRKRKKRRKKRYFLKALIVCCVLAGAYLIAMSDLFAIDQFEVKGDSFYTAVQVEELSGVPRGANIWKEKLGEAEARLMADPYIRKATVERNLPRGIRITVAERREDFVVPFDGKFAIVDFDGIVLRIADKAPALPLVEALAVKKAKPGKTLAVEENILLTDAISLLRAAEKSGMYFRRITCSAVSVKAYIYSNLACRGSFTMLTGSLDRIRTIFLELRKQKIRRGTIIVSGNGNCVFSPETP